VIATAGGSVLRLWDATKGEELRRSQGHQTPVRNIRFTADDRLVISEGEDGALLFWDAATGKEMRQLALTQGAIRARLALPMGAGRRACMPSTMLPRTSTNMPRTSTNMWCRCWTRPPARKFASSRERLQRAPDIARCLPRATGSSPSMAAGCAT
jgi:WD40 repeat protein